MPIPLWLDLLLLVLVVTAAVTDLAVRKIPNLLLLVAMCAAFALYLGTPAPMSNILSALGGALIGFALFIPLYAVRGMAAGDVKLMATVGLFFGPAQTIEACVLTWCVGGVMALVIILFTGRWGAAYANLRTLFMSMWLRLGPPSPERGLGRQSIGSMPYGLAIALTTLWMLAQRHHG